MPVIRPLDFRVKGALRIVFVIVVFAALWLPLYLAKTPENVEVEAPADFRQTAYVEKVDAFFMRVFSPAGAELYHISAATFLRFKNAPSLLLDAAVSFFDDNDTLIRSLYAENAYYLENGDFKFNEVVVRSAGGKSYQMNAESLILDADGNLQSETKIDYADQRTKILADKMHQPANGDSINFSSAVTIYQNAGGTFQTRDLTVEYFTDDAVFVTDQETVYEADDIRISAANMRFDTAAEKIELGGGVAAHYQKSADGAVVVRSKIVILDDKNGRDIYREDVVLTKNGSRFDGDKIVISRTNGKIDEIHASGAAQSTVQYRRDEAGKKSVAANARTMIYNPGKNTIKMSGAVVLAHGENSMSGETLVYDLNADQASVLKSATENRAVDFKIHLNP